MQRRRLLAGSWWMATALALSGPRGIAANLSPRFKRYPFTLGVASGYPTSSTVVLWTRLAPEPLSPDGGMAPEVVALTYEMASDEAFAHIVQSGNVWAEPDWAHSVHVDVRGLQPGRPYWYRFRAGDALSPVGRCATAPPAGQMPAKLRIAVASCQQYEQGYYTAYRHIAEGNTDLVLHVGDYIYESNFNGERVRQHNSSECYSLSDYRLRHSLYRLDANLQAAHAQCPWLLVTDDHEVDNDYAGETSEEDDDPRLFLARRAVAYKAYYEHMPLPRRALPLGPDMRMYASLACGDLAGFHMLDSRQYRSPIPCPRPGTRGANRIYADDCPALPDTHRTMLGARQEQWLQAQLVTSRARWNLLAQGVVVAQCDEDPGPRERYWTDSWNGYPAARQRLLESIAGSKAQNPVVLGGDIHAFVAADLRLRANDSKSPIVASELVTTGISSRGPDAQMLAGMAASGPDFVLADGRQRGYLRLELTPDSLKADLIGMDSVLVPAAPGRVSRSLVIENGVKGLQGR